jgi:putative zinc finger/helix-turn-helix YgiT family protein
MNNFTNTPMQTCPMCESKIRIELIDETMEYVTPSGPVTLHVTVPYEVCSSCGYHAFGEAGERARTNAIYKYHQRLNPTEIVEIRTGLGLSQNEYAETLGVGHASVERWETGVTMQNLSLNNLILALSRRSQIEWLHEEKRRRSKIDEAHHKVVSLDRFRCLTQKDQNALKEMGDRFKLRIKRQIRA